MDIGIFARTFRRPTVESTLDAVAAHGFRHVQFSMQCAGLPTLPEAIEPATVQRIRQAFDERGLTMTALSGTFNMAHPDEKMRYQGLDRLKVLASVANDLGTYTITLCTGTRDPEDLWRRHPDNDSRAAWADCCYSLAYAALVIADEHGVRLGIEPEPGNVVGSPLKAREMLHEIGSDAIGIVFDPANIIDGVPPDQVDTAIGSALAEIGHRIIAVHGKDRDASGKVVPAGQGIVPWALLFAKLRRLGFDGTMLLHDLDEREVPRAAAFLDDRRRAGEGNDHP